MRKECSECSEANLTLLFPQNVLGMLTLIVESVMCVLYIYLCSYFVEIKASARHFFSGTEEYILCETDIAVPD